MKPKLNAGVFTSKIDKKANKTNTNNTNPTHTKPASENSQKRSNYSRPSQPLIASLPPEVCPPCHPCISSDVRHVHFCISLLRRVSHIRQESSLELVSALSCLPPLCAIIHICINLNTSILFLARNACRKPLLSRTSGAHWHLSYSIHSLHCSHHASTSLWAGPRYAFSS